MEISKDWRPVNWERMRRQITQLPTEWSMSSACLPAAEQVVEHTAEVLMEAVAAEIGKTPGWVHQMVAKELADDTPQQKDTKSE